MVVERGFAVFSGATVENREYNCPPSTCAFLCAIVMSDFRHSEARGGYPRANDKRRRMPRTLAETLWRTKLTFSSLGKKVEHE